jgi:hypothetical protein
MASVERSRCVEKVVGYPPLSEMGDLQRREFHEAVLDADSFDDLPGKWQAAILEAEQESRPNLGPRTVVEWYRGGVDCSRYLLPVVDKGKLAARRGRKARGLGSEIARPPARTTPLRRFESWHPSTLVGSGGVPDVYAQSQR